MISKIILVLAVAVSLSACGGGGGTRGQGPADPVRPPAGLPVSLPSGHGLAAGEIRVASGGSVERGNVVVSCPAGGAACVVTVAVDGTASYQRTGGTPSVTAVLLGHNTGWLDNAKASDLADHWHVTVAQAAIAKAFGLEPATPGARDALASILRAKGQEVPTNMSILGETDGFTVGRWVSGPADHMPVDLDWSQWPNVPLHTRALAERAAKMWSHHISGLLDSYTINLAFQDGVEVSTQGVYIEMENGLAEGGCGQCAWTFVEQRSVTNYQGRHGIVQIAPSSSLYTALHEIAHVLTPNNGEYSIDPAYTTPEFHGEIMHYADLERFAWTGPRATAANGGPVPYLRIFGVERLPDGWLPVIGYDTAHFDIVANSILNHGSIGNLSSLDIAYLEDLGYEVTTPEIAHSNEIYSLGAWADSSMFSMTVTRDLDDDPQPDDDPDTWGVTGTHFDKVSASASAIGIEPNASFETAHQGKAGRATWSGILIGAALGVDGLPPVTGNSQITIDLSTLAGKATFTGLQMWTSGSAAPFRTGNLTYDVSVVGNRFEDVNRRVSGTWYGAEHEEIAGTLLDNRPSVNLIAAFGVKE